jgi:hypothetical protein
VGLFPHYPANPGAVDALAEKVLGDGDKVSSVGTSVSSQHRVSVSAVDGLLTSPLSSAIQPVLSSSNNIAQCTTIAGGALTMWSKAIKDYNDGVDKLNQEYETLKAANFNVDADQFYMHGATLTPQQREHNYHAAISNADLATRHRLEGEEHKLKELLDAEARTVQGILAKGPSKQAALILAANGALPKQAAVTFPDVLNEFKTHYDPADGTYALIEIGRFIKGQWDAEMALQKASLALLQGQHLADAEVDAVIHLFGDVTDPRVLRQYFASQEQLNDLTQAAIDAAHSRAGYSWTEAAAATGKFSKFFAGLGIASSIYDIGWNPDDHDGARRVADVTMDGVGVVGGVGALALGSEVLAGTALLANPVTGPIVVGCLVAAGAYAAGTYIYDHWDDIKNGVSTAIDWTGDKLDEAGEKVDEAKDWVEDKAESIPVIGGLF